MTQDSGVPLNIAFGLEDLLAVFILSSPEEKIVVPGNLFGKTFSGKAILIEHNEENDEYIFTVGDAEGEETVEL